MVGVIYDISGGKYESSFSDKDSSKAKRNDHDKTPTNNEVHLNTRSITGIVWNKDK